MYVWHKYGVVSKTLQPKKREKWRNSMITLYVDWLKFSLKSRTLPNRMKTIAFILRTYVRLSRQQNSTNHMLTFVFVSLTLLSFSALLLCICSLLRCTLWIYFIYMCVCLSFALASQPYGNVHEYDICCSVIREQEGQLRIVRRTQQTCIRAFTRFILNTKQNTFQFHSCVYDLHVYRWIR